MASGVIEQLLDFNQGNLYPKIADVDASYIGKSNVNGAAGFIKDLFDAEALDASIFGISGNKLSLKSGAVIPGTIDNASTADKVKSELKIKTSENKTEIYNGSAVVDITKVYQAETADVANKIKGSLKITYTDIDEKPISLDNWKGDNAEAFNISGISEAKYARNLKTDSGNPIIGNDPKLSSILTVSKDGAIAALDASIGTTATVLLSIKKNEDSYSYQWIDGTTVGGAGGAQVDQAALNTAYYVLGASASGQTTIYGNFTGRSPYFKNSNLYQTSDETLKTFTEDLDVNLDNLASIKKGLFYWNSDENKVLDIGVTAQSLEPLFPELVTETDGIKAVSYSKLSVVALAAIDKLYKRVKELEDEVEELKSK